MDVQQQDRGQGGTPDRVVPQENHVHTTLPQATRKPDVTGEKDVYEANVFIGENVFKIVTFTWHHFLSIMTFHPNI